MILDEFFVKGNNVHDWESMIATLRGIETEEVIYELQAATWNELRQYEFDDVLSPANEYMERLLAMCVSAINDAVGALSLSTATCNNGHASSLTVDGTEVYSYKDLKEILREQSGLNNFKSILHDIKASEHFDEANEYFAELLSDGVNATIANHRLSDAELGACAFDGLPVATLAKPIRLAIGAASFLKALISADLKDIYQGMNFILENEGVAILLSLDDEDGYIPIENFGDIVKLTK